jgi:hypothetical protein
MSIEAKGSFGLYAECPHCHIQCSMGFKFVRRVATLLPQPSKQQCKCFG